MAAHFIPAHLSGFLGSAYQSVVQLSVPDPLIPFILGTKGKTLRDLMSYSGASIKVPPPARALCAHLDDDYFETTFPHPTQFAGVPAWRHNSWDKPPPRDLQWDGGGHSNSPVFDSTAHSLRSTKATRPEKHQRPLIGGWEMGGGCFQVTRARMWGSFGAWGKAKSGHIILGGKKSICRGGGPWSSEPLPRARGFLRSARARDVS